MPSTPSVPRASAAAGLATVRELLVVDALRLRLVAGAAGQDRPVRWAHAIELPDPRPYLRGGELVLTMGSVLVDDDACARFVDAVLERDASGIGFGCGNFHEAAPAGLRAACDRAGLPLLEVPVDVPFIAITEELAERMASQRAERDRRRLRREAHLLDLLAEGQGAQGLATALSRDLRVAVAITDPDGALEALAGESAIAGTAGTTVDVAMVASATISRVHAGDRRATYEDGGLRSETVVVRNSGETVGWLVAVRPAGEPKPELTEALREAAAIVSIELATRAGERMRERRTVGRLLEMIRAGIADPVVLSERVAEASVDGTAIVASVWRRSDAEALRKLAPRAVLGETADRLYVVAGDDTRLETISLERSLPAGIGSTVRLRDLGRSLVEAEAAFAIAVGRSRVATWRDLASLPTLLGQQPPERLGAFAEQLVVPIVEYDARHGGDLLATLRTYLEAEGAVEASAALLHIHPNSLRHRLRRIRTLTGRDPSSFLDRVALFVGLWAWDAQHRRNQQQNEANVVVSDD